MPLRVRLTGLAVLGALVAVTLGGWIFTVQLRQNLHASVDSALRTRADALVQSVRDAGSAIDFQDSGSTRLLPAREAIAQIVGPTGALVESSEVAGRTILVPPSVLHAAGRGTVYAEQRLTGEEHLVRVLVTTVTRSDGRWVVLVGASLESADAAVDRVRTGIIVAGSLIVLLAAIGSWALATFALRPVERMRRRAESLSADAEDGHLPVPNTHDEIARLAITMNALLTRLHEALQRQRAFTADAGHELRTPLAVLRTELELAGVPTRTESELRASIAHAADEAERITALAEQLLFLARHDEDGAPANRELQPLLPILRSAVDAAAPAAEQQGVLITLDAQPELAATVDADALRRAVDNLIANALRYAPAKSAITITASIDHGQIIVAVRDHGPGFPPAFLPHAFERFRRADTARTRQDGGTGLGLAIVRAVAREHGGDATAVNEESGGATVSLRFPVM